MNSASAVCMRININQNGNYYYLSNWCHPQHSTSTCMYYYGNFYLKIKFNFLILQNLSNLFWTC